jgi:alkylation response protein AidB-like acyl-CoA dehydrogenase
MLFFPRDRVTIHDTWDTTGLRGTASNDFSTEDTFVPADRGMAMIGGDPVHPWVLYRAPMLIFMNHGSQALGVARAALETTKSIARAKIGWGDVPVYQLPRLQGMLAEATALVESGRAFLYGAAAELWEAVNADAPDTALLRGRVRLAASHAMRASVQAVDLVHAAVGTSAVFRSSPLERNFRDIHTAAAHVMVSQMTFEAAGRVELGLDPAFPFF